MHSHFEEKSLFLGEKSIKCPVLYAQFEEKFTFFEFLLLKTHWIIEQKSQNSARYYRYILGKSRFFGRGAKTYPRRTLCQFLCRYWRGKLIFDTVTLLDVFSTFYVDIPVSIWTNYLFLWGFFVYIPSSICTNFALFTSI